MPRRDTPVRHGRQAANPGRPDNDAGRVCWKLPKAIYFFAGAAAGLAAAGELGAALLPVDELPSL